MTTTVPPARRSADRVAAPVRLPSPRAVPEIEALPADAVPAVPVAPEPRDRPTTAHPHAVRTGRSTFTGRPDASAGTSALQAIEGRIDGGTVLPTRRRFVAVLRARGRAAQLVAVLVGLVTVAALAARQLLVGLGIPAPAGAREAALTAQAYALSGGTGLPTSGASLSDSLTARLMATYWVLTGAPGRYDDLTGAAREFLVVVVALGGLAAYVLARRLGLRVVAAAATVLAAGLPAVAATARVVAWSATVATALVLAGLACAVTAMVDRRLRLLSVPIALVLVAAAVVVAPVAALLPAGAALALAAMLSGGGWRTADRALVLVAALVAVLGTAYATVPAGDVAGPIGVWRTVGIGVGVVGLLFAGLAATVRYLRPFAVAALPVVLACLWPGPAQLDAAVLALVPVALLGAAYADVLVDGATRHRSRDVLVTVVTLGAATVLVLLTAPGVTPSGPVGAPYVAAARWLVTQVPAGTTVAADPLTRAELVRRGVPAERIVTSGDADLDVLPAAASGTGPTVARFGTGDAALVVRMPGGGSTYAATVEAARPDRIAFGADLLANPQLVVAGSMRPLFEQGQVDGRLLTLLSLLSTSNIRVTVTDLPDPDGVGSLRRTVVLDDATAADPQSPVGGATSRLQQLFEAQQPPYRPMSVTVTGTTVTVTFPAPAEGAVAGLG